MSERPGIKVGTPVPGLLLFQRDCPARRVPG